MGLNEASAPWASIGQVVKEPFSAVKLFKAGHALRAIALGRSNGDDTSAFDRMGLQGLHAATGGRAVVANDGLLRGLARRLGVLLL